MGLGKLIKLFWLALRRPELKAHMLVKLEDQNRRESGEVVPFDPPPRIVEVEKVVEVPKVVVETIEVPKVIVKTIKGHSFHHGTTYGRT